MGNYYSDDFDGNNESRLKYFDYQFEVLSQKIARGLGINISEYFSNLTSFSKFKEYLQTAFSEDASLSNYLSGMGDDDLKKFYGRRIIKRIVEKNRERLTEEIEEIPQIRNIPDEIKQVEKKNILLFKSEFIEKKTKKKRLTLSKRTSVNVRGKKQVRYRDSKGRFVKQR